KIGLLRSIQKECLRTTTMPDPTLQEQPKISLTNLAAKSYITYHILPILHHPIFNFLGA
ncbi:hypothetical protein ACTXT7_017256, partial [Hymenolepis weldensis]